MTASAIETVLMPISFAFLLLLMLAYWSQAAIFSSLPYYKTTKLLFSFSLALLTSILVIRWKESGHFPLSNLYESLVFLSWSFLMSNLVLEYSSKDFTYLFPNSVHTSVSSNTDNRNRERMTNANKQREQGQGQGATPFEPKALAVQNQATDQVLALREDPPEKYGMILPDMIGVITSPMALVTYAFAFLKLPEDMQKATSLLPALQSNWLMMHVTIMIGSYAALISGSLLSMAFLLVTQLSHYHSVKQQTDKHNNRQGKHQGKKQMLDFEGIEAKDSYSSSFQLAATLDNLSYRLLGLGFPLLTIGILSGAVWANEAWGSYWSWDPKETWALITWLVFAIYLHARITKGWSGQRPALIATLGFFVVWFCYLGVNLLGTGLHSYGWFS